MATAQNSATSSAEILEGFGEKTISADTLRVGKLVNQYAKNGNAVFVYELEGTPEKIAEMQEISGANYRESENGKPLFFSTNQELSAGTVIAPNWDGANVRRMVVQRDLSALAKQNRAKQELLNLYRSAGYDEDTVVDKTAAAIAAAIY